MPASGTMKRTSSSASRMRPGSADERVRRRYCQAHAAAADPADVEAAVRAARAAFDTGPWPRLPVAERLDAVRRLADVYDTHLDEMADLITAEMGSPASFSRLGQAAGAATMMRLTLADAEAFPWQERRRGLLGEVHLRRQPVGVVGIIIPWNVPQNLLMPKLIPALLAGCTVVIKPAPETPLERSPWLPLRHAVALDTSADWMPQLWRDLDTALAAAPLGDPGTALVLGRAGGPEFLASEVNRLGYLAGVVASLLR